MGHTRHLWRFLPVNETIKGEILTAGMGNPNAAPELLPLTNFDPASPHPDLINVVEDFEWTHTPKFGRQEVPYIRLSEYRVEFNSLIQNIRYMLSIGGDVMGKITGAAGLGRSSTSGAAVTKAEKAKYEIRKKEWNDMTAAQRAADPTGANILDKRLANNKSYIDATVAHAKAKDKAQSGGRMAAMKDFALEAALSTEGKNIPQYLKPYYGLYGVQPTGFEYAFPYFQSDYHKTTTAWGELKGGGLAGGILSEVETFLKEDLLKTAELLPGVRGAYVERPKMYNYPTDGITKTFTFQLANTNDVNDIAKNWQLCYMLLYQQMPNKISKVLLEPPVIYEVEIPGQWYTPFAFINGVSIVNRGAIRKMKVPVLYDKGLREQLDLPPKESDRDQPTWNSTLKHTKPSKTTASPPGRAPKQTNNSNSPSGPKPSKLVTGRAQQGSTTAASDPVEEWVETIVPDAWEITISIQSLVPESKNLLFHSTLGPGTKNTGLYNVSLKDPANETLRQIGNKKGKADGIGMGGGSEAIRRALKQDYRSTGTDIGI